MEEIWLPIEGYESYYLVSSHGRVASLSFRNNRGVFDRFKILSPNDNGYGYLIVQLKSGGKRKSHYIHRLVAEAFLDKSDATHVVNHKDHNKHNNKLHNLEWCSQQENVQKSISLMCHPKLVSRLSNTGEKYISQKRSNLYCVCLKIDGKRRDKYFKNLVDAIKYRNEVIGIAV